jgi:hypothetical protein
MKAELGVAESEHDVAKGSGVLDEQCLPEVRLARGDAEEAIRLLHRALPLARWSMSARPGGSGNGEQIAANKVPRVRAALAWNADTARLALKHNDANVIAVGGRQHTPEEAAELVLLFLDTPFSGDERHLRRIGLVSDYERDRHRPAGTAHAAPRSLS